MHPNGSVAFKITVVKYANHLIGLGMATESTDSAHTHKQRSTARQLTVFTAIDRFINSTEHSGGQLYTSIRTGSHPGVNCSTNKEQYRKNKKLSCR